MSYYKHLEHVAQMNVYRIFDLFNSGILEYGESGVMSVLSSDCSLSWVCLGDAPRWLTPVERTYITAFKIMGAADILKLIRGMVDSVPDGHFQHSSFVVKMLQATGQDGNVQNIFHVKCGAKFLGTQVLVEMTKDGAATDFDNESRRIGIANTRNIECFCEMCFQVDDKEAKISAIEIAFRF